MSYMNFLSLLCLELTGVVAGALTPDLKAIAIIIAMFFSFISSLVTSKGSVSFVFLHWSSDL
jgi:hypothetical protein